MDGGGHHDSDGGGVDVDDGGADDVENHDPGQLQLSIAGVWTKYLTST